MKNLRILEATEVGHGILIEMDAGHVSPKDRMLVQNFECQERRGLCVC